MDPFGTAGYVAMSRFLGGCCSCRKYILGALKLVFGQGLMVAQCFMLLESCSNSLLHEVRHATEIDGRMYGIYQDHSKSGYIDANGQQKLK